MLGVYRPRVGPPGAQLTELAGLKMPGALEAVTAGAAIELVLNAQVAPPNNGARSLPGNMLASVDWRRAGDPAALVDRRATLTLVNRAGRPPRPRPLPRSARQGEARTARPIFSYPAARW